jgi:hypothetical protein
MSFQESVIYLGDGYWFPSSHVFPLFQRFASIKFKTIKGGTKNASFTKQVPVIADCRTVAKYFQGLEMSTAEVVNFWAKHPNPLASRKFGVGFKGKLKRYCRAFVFVCPFCD